ncbi:hypothetical protein D0860_08545 [Hortaea werneckii]|uniref:HIT-type domain-containing protein n=1 Tax=Hortaea werneckii TaxID=91943 RepID=A0A3M7GC62_HORWE|nr:hypothetical protein D0860_08545 [Hortaea werneckii]
MSTSTPLCGICTASESKYKCPVCSLRYCSLACYKRHQSLHNTTIPPSSSSEDPITTTTQPPQSPTRPPSSRPRPDRPRPGTNHRRIPPHKIDFTQFDTDPDFISLLHRYPRLKIQLQALYALTLEPGPEDARTWSREPLPGDAIPSTSQGFHSRGRGGGRGGRRGGRGSGRGGSGVGGDARTPAGGRQHGVWTAEKGEKEALGVMRRMRSGNRGTTTTSGGGGGDKAEGLKEFVEWCMLRFGPEESQRGEGEEGEGMTG